MRVQGLVVCLCLLAACGGDTAKKESRTALEAERSAEQRREVTVQQVSTIRAPAEAVSAPGKVEVDPGKLSKVTISMPGHVAQVLVGIGDAVKQGTPVMVVDSPDTGTAVSNFRQAQAKVVQGKSGVTKAEADLSREEDLLSHGAVPEKEVLSARAQLTQAKSELAQAEAAEEEAREKLNVFGIDGTAKTTNRIVLHSPVSGKVLELNVVAGEYRSDTSAPVMTIADLSTVFMTADVPETSIRLVHVGQDVAIKLDAYPGETIPGRVFRIGDTVEPTTRTIRVRVTLKNPQGRFRPDMFGDLEISGGTREVVAIPAGALVRAPEGTLAYRESAAGKFEPVKVTAGQQVDGKVVILAGLGRNDRIVTDGVMLLRAAAR